MTLRTRYQAAAAAAGAILLSGCLGDPPPDPEVQPLEVVIGSSTMPDEPCLLNVDEVAAGEHEVAVIDESGGPASVVLRGPTGEVVFESDAEASEGAPASATLAEGDHVVQCLSGGALLGEAPLRVVAARS